MSEIYIEDLKTFKRLLDKVSPTFCAAKWKQVTVHLESGLTHSCHHPTPHKIPLNELKDNPSALHNTQFKKDMRDMMLKGEIVPECEYCNRVEENCTIDLNPETYSDRVFKSHNPWARKYIPVIRKADPQDNVYPSYLEVSFSSTCNLCCVYCSPTSSSRWEDEIKKFGPYDLKMSARGKSDSPPPDYNPGKEKGGNNPYREAFWKWFPELYENLDMLRLTGGEPLLNEDTFKVLDHAIETPKKDLKLSVNSNLCVGGKLFEKFMEKCKQITENQEFKLFTSGEAQGERLEYIRTGLNYKHWMENCRTFLREVPKSRLTYMATFNILAVSSFQGFLNDVLKLKNEFRGRVRVDIPLLVTPRYLQADIITKDFVKYIEDSITFMYKNQEVSQWPPLKGKGFEESETIKLIRILNLVKGKPENDGVTKSRVEFYRFINQRDDRYNTNFLEVFPEYKQFFLKCKELANE
jgi:organic radical activating enzyme